MKKLLVTLGLCSLSALSLAQGTGAKPSSHAAAQLISVGFSMQMLEKRIPVNFKGMDPKTLIAAIERKTASLIKGEFESSVDFDARRVNVFSGVLLDSVRFGGKLVFTASVGQSDDSTNGFAYRYNADSQLVTFLVQPKLAGINSIGGPKVRASETINWRVAQFDLLSQLVSKRTYVGTNAFGVKTNVEETIIDRYGVISGPSVWFGGSIGRQFEIVPIEIKEMLMGAEQAIRELPKLKVLFVAGMEAPYVGYDFKRTEPTRDFPYDTSIRRAFINARLEGVIFYSGITGEIFARMPEGFGESEAAKEARAVVEAGAQRAKRAAAAAALEAAAPDDARRAHSSALVNIQAGRARMTWTKSDNGSDVGFADAQAWCAAHGENWVIPSVEDLLSLYDVKGVMGYTPCNGWSCKVSSEFKLSGMLFWSNKTSVNGDVAMVDLESGTAKMSASSPGTNKRVLCVLKSGE